MDGGRAQNILDLVLANLGIESSVGSSAEKLGSDEHESFVL
jgi:hypothetical protein